MDSRHKSRLFRSGFLELEQGTDHLLPIVRDMKPSLESGRYGSDLTQSFPLDHATQPETVLGVEDARVSEFFQSIASSLKLGPFSSAHTILHRYHKSKAMNWHHDVFDRASVLILAYVNEHLFSEEDGGVLEIARCEVNAEGFPVGTPAVVHRVLPNPNTVVVINNTDPTVLHRVTPMKTSKTRTVLSCQLGYSEITVR